MDMTMKMPMPGQKFRHFKGMLYQVISVATHTETEEKLVVYQALYGEFKVYARPLEMFLERVDKEKYPKATQEFRFEPVEELEKTADDAVETITEEKAKEKIAKEEIAEEKIVEEVNEEVAYTRQEDEKPTNEQEAIMYFLDRDTYEEKWNALSVIREFVSDRMIDTLAAALDIVIPEGDLEDRFDQLRICINTQRRYEVNR